MDCKDEINEYHVKPEIEPCLQGSLENALNTKETQIEYSTKHLQNEKANSFNAKVVKVEVQHEIHNESNDPVENDCTLVKGEVVNDSNKLEKNFNEIEKNILKEEEPSDLEEDIHQYEFEGLDFPSVKAEPPDGTDAEIIASEGNQQSDNLGEQCIHSEEIVTKAEPGDELSYGIADNQQFDSLEEKFNYTERTVIKIEPTKEFSFKTEPKEKIIYEAEDLKDFSVKVESENLNDMEMLYNEDNRTLKLEAVDLEAAFRGEDGGPVGILKEEETSQDLNGNSKIAHFVHLWNVMFCL